MIHRRAHPIFASIVFSALVFSLPAQAFIFIGFSEYSNPGTRPVNRANYWSGRSLTFRVNPNQSVYSGSLAPELTQAEFVASIQSAVAAWNGVCGSNIQVVLGSDTTAIKAGGDSINSISWDNRTTGEGNSMSTSTLGVAYSAVYTSGGVIDQYADCDIVVNGNSTGDLGVGGEFAKYDLISVLVHEIGHCLGLDHSIVPGVYTASNPILTNAVMAALLSNGDTSKRVLSQDEVDAMECVYPTGSSFKSGTRCGSFHGTTNPAGLSGTVSGGPAATIACGASDPTSSPAATGSGSSAKKSGGGCFSKAQADGIHPEESATFAEILGAMGWMLTIAFYHLSRKAWLAFKRV